MGKKHEPVLKVCELCGHPFYGGPWSKYCEDCAKVRRAAHTKEYRDKKASKDNVVEALQNASEITRMELDRQSKKGLVPRKCKKCGEVYWTKSNDSYLCPRCAEENRKNGVYQNRICATCGISFLGYPRSKYCPECAKAAQREAEKRSRARKKAGKTRSLGSIDICQNCGKPYTVTSGLQKYCPDCSKYVVGENIKELKRAYMEQNREYFNELHRKARQGRRVCVICGKTFDSSTNTSTCSADCEAELTHRRNTRAAVKKGRTKPIRLLGRRGPVNPQSGVPGIHYHAKTGKWELVLNHKYCGLYDTVAEAAEEREKILKQEDDTNAQNN